MVSVTLSVPKETRELMSKFPEVNWSGFVRKCIEQRTVRLAWKEEMLVKLKQEEKFEERALEIGDKIKEGMWEQYKKEGW